MDDSLIRHIPIMHMAIPTAISLSMYRTHGQESLCILNTFCLGTEEETVPMMLTSRLLKISNYMNKNKITKFLRNVIRLKENEISQYLRYMMAAQHPHLFLQHYVERLFQAHFILQVGIFTSILWWIVREVVDAILIEELMTSLILAAWCKDKVDISNALPRWISRHVISRLR